MLKKLIDKRIDAFKEKFPEYEVSRNGNIYYREGVREVERRIRFNDLSVTKNTINKLGTTTVFKEKTSQNVYLITKKGKLMQRNSMNRFTNLTLKKSKYTNLLDIWMIGRKYEWMKDYPALLEYKFFQSFGNLSEAKNFLGYSFLSDKDFYQIFIDGNNTQVLYMVIKAKNKANVAKLLKNLDYDTRQLLKDYIQICEEKGYDLDIPAGKNALREIHDNAIWEARKEDAENYSRLEIYDGKDCAFEDEWRKRGIDFKRIMSPYEMYEIGAKQQFCLGTNYYNQLHNYSFYSVFYEGKEYEMQISTSGYVNQFHGYKNIVNPPQELKDKLIKDVDLKHSIIKLKDFHPDEYPKVKNGKKEIDEILEPEEDDDYLPW